MKFGVGQSPTRIEDPILHSTRFILVDETGAIRAYRDSTEGNVVAQLLADIETLNEQRRP